MRRNQVKMHDNVVLLLQDRAEARQERLLILEEISALKDAVNKSSFTKKAGSVSVVRMFPIKRQQQILDFLDDSDGLFKERCAGFYDYLFSLRTDDEKKFIEALKDHLFSREYAQSHHWPNVV